MTTNSLNACFVRVRKLNIAGEILRFIHLFTCFMD